MSYIYDYLKGTRDLKILTNPNKEGFNSLTDIGIIKLEANFLNPKVTFANLVYEYDEFDQFIKKINFKDNFPSYHSGFVNAYKRIFENTNKTGDPELSVYKKYFEQFIASEFLKTTGAKGVMDIACAACPFVGYASSKFNATNCYAQDLTETPNKTKYLKENEAVTILKCNATDIPLEDSVLDFICLLNSWEHFQAPYDFEVLKESCRLLRKKGKLLITPLNISKSACVEDSLMNKKINNKDSGFDIK